MTLPLPDWDARRRAVLTDGHALVWAGAGTGKTHTLTLRAVRLLFRLGAPELFSPDETRRARAAQAAVSSLVLITFTQKAAAEMQDRLLRSLVRIADVGELNLLEEVLRNEGEDLFAELAADLKGLPAVSSDEDFRRGVLSLADELVDLRISTIHSYALDLLQRYPLASGLPADLRIGEEEAEGTEDFEKAAFRHWWRTRVEATSQGQEWLHHLVLVLKPEELREVLTALAGRPWLTENLARLAVPTSPDERLRLRECLAFLGSACKETGGSKWERMGRRLHSLLGAEPVNWREIGRLLISEQTSLWGKRSQKLSEALSKAQSPVRELLEDRARLLGLVSRQALWDDKPEVSRAWRELVTAYGTWRQERAVGELGRISFDEILYRAVHLLRRHESVRAREQARLRYILVDEFQDTDPVQLELLELLLVPVVSGSGPQAFLVGDVKQSIYRFRGADTAAVQSFCTRLRRLHGAALEEFNLVTSFRSRPQVLDFVNRTFEKALPLATKREQLAPFRESGDPEAVTALIALPAEPPDKGKLSADERRRLAAEAIVQTVRRHAAAGGRWEDVLVVARTQVELDTLLPRLADEGIPVASAGARSFQVQLEVLDCLNLLIALLHPGDGLAHLALLRSPLVALPDAWIQDLYSQDDPGWWLHSRRPLPDVLPEGARLRLENLRALAQSRGDKTWLDWLVEVRALVFPYLYSGKDDEGEETARLRIERVWGEFARHLNSPEPLLNRLLEQRAKVAQPAWLRQLSEDISLVDEALQAVRVMTVHQAKGLESNVVIVADWPKLVDEADSDTGRRHRKSVLELTDDQGVPRREFQFSWDGIWFESSGYASALEVDCRQDAEEARRIAYVAATRARERLVLIHPVSRLDEEGGKILNWMEVLVENEPDRSGEEENPPDFEARLQVLSRKLQQASHPVIRLETASFSLHPRRKRSSPDRAPLFGADYAAYWRERLSSCRRQEGAYLLHRPTLEDPWREESATEAGRESPDLALEVGRLVHGYLERGLRHADFRSELLSDLVGEVGGDQLPKEGRGGASHIQAAAKPAGKILRAFFAGKILDSSGRKLIERVQQGTILAQELPIYLSVRGEAWHGVIDLVLEEATQIVGVDFKTSTPVAPLPSAYLHQREIYLEALRRLFPERPVCFEFWWLTSADA
ncbi:MAG TPA: UvrD-helicase domain-containing protein [Acidobacteriota bacterium]|nr:UvrD-helicase domain-containing protein [Acidobacteriota bacterium]